MHSKKSGGYSKLIQGINSLPSSLQTMSEVWAKTTAENAHELYINNLNTQGREGGTGPALSGMKVKRDDNEPRLRDQLKIEYNQKDGYWSATIGFPPGRWTAAAIAQDQGSTRKVTDKMRNWFIFVGYPLNADTKFIDTPGRYSWTLAIKEARRQGKKELEELFKTLMNLLFD